MTFRRAALAAVALVVGFTIPRGMSESAADVASYAAIASADSARVTVKTPGAPLSESIIDSGGPRAQASSGGVDGNIGYAAAPDPGEFLVGLPSALRGLAGVDLPEYPLVAKSGYPATPESTAEAPGVRITSKSSRSRTDASVSLGTADGAVEVTAEAGSSDDGIAAEAEVVISHVAIGPLRLGGVKSRAVLRRNEKGELLRGSEFTVASANVAGVPVRVGASGLSYGNSSRSLPDTSPVGHLLTAAGITVSVLPSISSKTTESSSALMITAPLPATFTTPGTFTLVLGRTTASLAVIDSEMTAPVVGPTEADADVVVGTDGSLPLSPSGQVFEGVTNSPELGITRASSSPISWPLRDIYFVVVASGLALSAGGSALRRFGMRP